jgi:kynurenine formamidase
MGLKLLGVDAPSVDARESKSLAVHKMLFSGNAFILENLDLRRVAPAGARIGKRVNGTRCEGQGSRVCLEVAGS